MASMKKKKGKKSGGGGSTSIMMNQVEQMNLPGMQLGNFGENEQTAVPDQQVQYVGGSLGR